MLPAGSLAPVWPGEQDRVLPAVNRTTGPAGPDPDDLRPGVVLSAQARWLLQNIERTPPGYSFFGREGLPPTANSFYRPLHRRGRRLCNWTCMLMRPGSWWPTAG